MDLLKFLDDNNPRCVLVLDDSDIFYLKLICKDIATLTIHLNNTTLDILNNIKSNYIIDVCDLHLPKWDLWPLILKNSKINKLFIGTDLFSSDEFYLLTIPIKIRIIIVNVYPEDDIINIQKMLNLISQLKNTTLAKIIMKNMPENLEIVKNANTENWDIYLLTKIELVYKF